MSVTVSASRVVICLVIAAIATFCWWLCLDVAHWPAWVAMLVFGFVLLVLGISVTYTPAKG